MAGNHKKKGKKNRSNKKDNLQKQIVNEEDGKPITEVEQDITEHEKIDHESHEEPSDVNRKREHNEDDSDAEDKPKKKKKKKKLLPDATPDKKGKKSIRQMKKEKFVQRQAEAQAAAKDQLKSQCMSYLSQWKHDRDNWKFMKAKQVWLYKNKFSSHLLPDVSWPLFLEYFESAKGNIRNMLLDDANKVIKQMDEWMEAQNSSNKNEDETEELETDNKPDEISYKRARDLIQCLQE